MIARSLSPIRLCLFSTTGSIRSNPAFEIAPANSCKPCSKPKLDEVLASSRYVRGMKPSGGDSEEARGVTVKQARDAVIDLAPNLRAKKQQLTQEGA
jgi:hypothetical protein